MVKRKRATSDYIQLNVRMKEALRRQVEKAADKNGISMNSEVVHRLDRSFAHEDPLMHFFGDRDRFFLALAIIRWIESAEELTGQKWLEDDYTYEVAVSRIVTFFYQGGLFLGESHKDFPKISSPLGAGHLRVPLERHRQHMKSDLAHYGPQFENRGQERMRMGGKK